MNFVMYNIFVTFNSEIFFKFFLFPSLSKNLIASRITNFVIYNIFVAFNFGLWIFLRVRSNCSNVIKDL